MSLPLPTRYIDIRTGLLYDSAGGLQSGQLIFQQGGVFVLPVKFCDNTTDQTDSVTGTGTATIATTLRASVGGVVLASSTAYTYGSATASLSLNFNTAELAAYFTSTVPGDMATMRLEIRVTLSGQVMAYYSSPVTVMRSVYDGTTATSVLAGGVVLAFTTQAQLTAISTVTASTNTVLQGTISGAFVTVQLAAGSQSTGSGYYRPDDYNASTNQRVWVQLQ